ncbi:MAG: hypothetical protein ACK4PR_06690 [Gammaproteobacteria bacterium]
MIGKELSDLLYGLALFANALLFLPQAWRMYTQKNANQSSLITFAGFNIIQLLGFINGCYNNDPALIIGQLISFTACGLITIQIVLSKLNPIKIPADDA